jgi:hypothetical protein
MRVITEDNIDQIESMSFSNNYKILSGQTDSIDADIELEGGRGKKAKNGSQSNNEFRLIISEPGRDDEYMKENISSHDDKSNNVEEIVIEKIDDDISPDLQMLHGNLIASQLQSKQNANPNSNDNDVNLDLDLNASGEGDRDSLGKEWTKLVDQASGKEYYYNEVTKDTMWYPPQPSKDYELRPPFGWYAVDIAGHIYLYNPQKNLIKMPEDVTFADANERPEEAVEKKEEIKSENLPSILMIEKTGETNDDENGSSVFF